MPAGETVSAVKSTDAFFSHPEWLKVKMKSVFRGVFPERGAAFELLLVCRTKRLWMPQAQAVISLMLAGQLPCFLLTESNMQHPQKKRQRGFCLPFLGRLFQGGGWERLDQDVQLTLLFLFHCFTSAVCQQGSGQLCQIRLNSRNDWWDFGV